MKSLDKPKKIILNSFELDIKCYINIFIDIYNTSINFYSPKKITKNKQFQYIFNYIFFYNYLHNLQKKFTSKYSQQNFTIQTIS